MKQKSKAYPMHLLTNLDGLRAQYALSSWALADLSIGYDNRIYLLLEKPEFSEDTKIKQQQKTDYKGLILTLNWQSGELLDDRLVDFGMRKENFHFFQPLGDDLLLVGARCRLYKNKTVDQNAVCFDHMGNQLERFCVGDGIERCMTDSAQNLIVSYFDEGIFGNYGWGMGEMDDIPLGERGVVYWSREGKKLWENTDCDIWDCYACNLDAKERLWFYYYGEFELVCTDYETLTRFQTPISGSNAFLIGQEPQPSFLFRGGYGESQKFYTMRQDQHQLSAPQPCQLTGENGEELFGNTCCFYQSKAAILDEDRRIWIMDWPGIAKEEFR